MSNSAEKNVSLIINHGVVSSPDSVNHEKKKKTEDSTDPLILALLTLVTSVNLLKNSAIADTKKLTNSEQINVQSISAMQTVIADQPELKIQDAPQHKTESLWEKMTDALTSILPGNAGVKEALAMAIEGVVILGLGAVACTGVGAVLEATGIGAAVSAAAGAAWGATSSAVAAAFGGSAAAAEVGAEGAAVAAEVGAGGAAVAAEAGAGAAVVSEAEAGAVVAEEAAESSSCCLNVMKTMVKAAGYIGFRVGVGATIQQLTFNKILITTTQVLPNEADWQRQLTQEQQSSLTSTVIQQEMANTAQYQEALGNRLQDKLAKASEDIDSCMSLLSSIGTTSRLITTRV